MKRGASVRAHLPKQVAPHRFHQKRGLPPGSLIHVGAIKTPRPQLSWLSYSPSSFNWIERATQILPDPAGTTWVNLHGLQDTALLKSISDAYPLHPLVQEDILNTSQRAKVELYPEALFIVVQLLQRTRTQADSMPELQSDQISFVLGRDWLLSFQERSTGLFTEIRERLSVGHVQQRKGKADYLLYALLDALVDHHFALLEEFSEDIEALEDALIAHPDPSQIACLYTYKRQLLMFRRSVWPLREILNSLTRDDADWFLADTQLYLRDVYDHAVHLLETVEALRDQLSGMLDLYMNVTGYRLNKDMRVLTVITTIFMPLTLISSIYGMNFENMPELHTQWGYFGVLGGMGVLAVGMGIYFWRRWF